MNSSFQTSESQCSDVYSSSTKIVIAINDAPQQVHLGSNLQSIIDQFSLSDTGYVFAINNQVVPRSEWNSTMLAEGDSISLFQAIAGG